MHCRRQAAEARSLRLLKRVRLGALRCLRRLARRRHLASALRHGDVRERRLAKFRQNVARFRLYRLRFLQVNMRFAAFFKIYQIMQLKILKKWQNFAKFAKFAKFLLKFHENC